MSWIHYVWNYDIRVVPVFLAMLLVEMPTAIRKRQKFYYVPIYFSVFPLRELNADLAHYLGEDYFLGVEPDERAAEQLRRKITWTSVVSLALSALVIPVFAGFVSAFFLQTPLLHQFVLVFILYKSIGIIRAIHDFPQHGIGTRRNTAFLMAIYVGYLGVASEMIIKAFHFARRFVEQSDWSGLAASTSDLVFSRVVAEFLILALVTTAFSNLVMDRKVRGENLSQIRGYDSDRKDDAVG